MSYTFISMPVKPSDKEHVGTVIAPVLCDYLGDVFTNFQSHKIITVNLLHSYDNRDKFLNHYLNSIDKLGIKYDEILKDKDLCNKILDSIYNMVELGIIKETKEKILRCQCGRVELSRQGVRVKNNASLYHIDKEKMICNYCKSECREYIENILYIPIDKDKIDDTLVNPLFLKKCVNGKINDIGNSKFIISKLRDTGCLINYCGNNYYIDIDFMWMNMFRFINSDNKILISGNKQSLKVFYINYIYSIYYKEKINFLMHPILKNVDNGIFNRHSNYLVKRLAILFNLSWNRESCLWNSQIEEYLNKLSFKQLHELYENMITISNENINSKYDLCKMIDLVLKHNTNFQKVKSFIR